jgi:phytoene dehydrogenase-like protein
MLRVAVIGGSIGGLATARVFHRLGASVRVFEKSPTSFEGRGGVRARRSALQRPWRSGFDLVASTLRLTRAPQSIGYCNVDLWQEVCGKQMLRRGRQASRSQGAFLYGAT